MLTIHRLAGLLVALAGASVFMLIAWGRARRAVDPLAQLTDADCLRDAMGSQFTGRASRTHLLMVDIDGFHRVNREYGESEGDRVLQAVTHTLRRQLHSPDLLCRYAGDRFAILLCDRDAVAALALAAHLRCAVASMRHHALHNGQLIPLSVRSATRSLDVDPHHALRELNRALERRMPSSGREPRQERRLQSR